MTRITVIITIIATVALAGPAPLLAADRGAPVDSGTGFLFWAVTEITASSVWRAHTDGSGATRLTGGFDIHCVVADLAAGKLYWSVDPYDGSPGHIARANLDDTIDWWRLVLVEFDDYFDF